MFKENKKLTNIIIVTALLLLAFLFWLAILIFDDKKELLDNGMVYIAGQDIKVKIAKTASQKAIGLGQVKSLPGNRGMLFAYDGYVIPNFWMKDMEFPIDIIWIKDGMVIGFEKDLKPQANNTGLPTYQPKTFINYVLEVNSGFVDKYGLKIGDAVEIRI